MSQKKIKKIRTNIDNIDKQIIKLLGARKKEVLKITKYKSKKTNPNIAVFARDENYVQSGGLDLAQGRNFNAVEVQHSANVVIIAAEVKKKLFPNQKKIIPQIDLISTFK